MSQMQCLGSGSIGSAKFGLPGSGSANISTKKCKKDIIKFPHFWMVYQVLG